MYYTIYKITNQIDGKFYIGSHKTVDLNDTYMGSGKYLRHAQEKYGIENFKKEILFVFETAEEMYAKEAEIVNEDFLVTQNTYNLKIGGFGGFDYINNSKLSFGGSETQKSLNLRAQEKIKWLYENDSDWADNRKKQNRKNLKFADEARKIKCPNGGFYKKQHTEQTKKAIGSINSIKQSGEKNSQFGTMWITDETSNKKIKRDSLIPDGWRKGRI